MTAPLIALPRLFPLEALTKHVGFSRNTAYRLVAIGKIKTRRIGGRLYVTEADAQAFLAGDSQPSEAPRTP